MEHLHPLSRDFWLGIVVAVFCGGIVGLERQVRGKPAGIRTSILICLGTAIFVQLGGLFGTRVADPTRVLAQVVTGVGFLGGGVILAREGLVTGVTSATVIWVLAAIGAAIGFHQYAAATVYALVTVAIVAGIEQLETTFRVLGKESRNDEAHQLAARGHRGERTDTPQPPRPLS